MVRLLLLLLLWRDESSGSSHRLVRDQRPIGAWSKSKLPLFPRNVMSFCGPGGAYRIEQELFLGFGTFFLRTSRTKVSKTAFTLAPVSALVSI